MIALFPEIAIVGTNPYACESYMHGGRFGSTAGSLATRTYVGHREVWGLTDDFRVVDITQLISDSAPASPSESEQLKLEIEGHGYSLRVCQRLSNAMLCKAIEAARKLPSETGPIRSSAHEVRIVETRTPASESSSGTLKTINSRLAGVSFTNSDGSARQTIIARCQPKELLRLEREPGNAFDNRAVRVLRLNGEQLGYLPADLVGNDQSIGWCIAKRMDAGYHVRAVISTIRRTDDEEMLGAALNLTLWDGPLEEEPDDLKRDPSTSLGLEAVKCPDYTELPNVHHGPLSIAVAILTLLIVLVLYEHGC